MSEPKPFPLYKQRSLSSDTYREEVWLKRKDNSRRRSKSVTDEDLDELKACIELGFGFDSPVRDRRLSNTLPALDLYYAVTKQYNDSVSKSPTASECDASDCGSPQSIFGRGGEDEIKAMGPGRCLFGAPKLLNYHFRKLTLFPAKYVNMGNLALRKRVVEALEKLTCSN